jgi:hypothetical protein
MLGDMLGKTKKKGNERKPGDRRPPEREDIFCSRADDEFRISGSSGMHPSMAVFKPTSRRTRHQS